MKVSKKTTIAAKQYFLLSKDSLYTWIFQSKEVYMSLFLILERGYKVQNHFKLFFSWKNVALKKGRNS